MSMSPSIHVLKPNPQCDGILEVGPLGSEHEAEHESD